MSTLGMLLLCRIDDVFFPGFFTQISMILLVKYFGHHKPILTSYFRGHILYNYFPHDHLMGIIHGLAV
jgi:hypothetical protein